MFDFLQKLTGPRLTGKQDTAPARKLASAADLMVGDIVVFGFLPQKDLSNQRFQVTEITTYDFVGEQTTRFALRGENNTLIYLAEETEEGETYLAVSQRMTRDVVGLVFGLDNFARIFDEGPMTLGVKDHPAFAEGWIADSYYKATDCEKAYCHPGDYRASTLPFYEDESKGFDYYLMLDDSDEYAVEIHVRDHGDTEVYVTVYVSCSAIKELWPS